MADYLPRKESDLETWTRNFAQNLAADPTAFGLVPTDSQKVQQALEAYAAALALAQAPGTRTRVQVHAKNEAKADLLMLLRQYGRRIKADAAVDNEHKRLLGLTLNGNGATARALREAGGVGAGAGIGSCPLLQVLLATPRRHKLIALDASGGQRRAKPAGAVGLQVFCHVGQTPPAEPLQAQFLRLVTRQPFTVDFKAEQIRQTAFYFARWQNAKGQTGPWSQMVSMTIAG